MDPLGARWRSRRSDKVCRACRAFYHGPMGGRALRLVSALLTVALLVVSAPGATTVAQDQACQDESGRAIPAPPYDVPAVLVHVGWDAKDDLAFRYYATTAPPPALSASDGVYASWASGCGGGADWCSKPRPLVLADGIITDAWGNNYTTEPGTYSIVVETYGICAYFLEDLSKDQARYDATKKRTGGTADVSARLEFYEAGQATPYATRDLGSIPVPVSDEAPPYAEIARAFGTTVSLPIEGASSDDRAAESTSGPEPGALDTGSTPGARAEDSLRDSVDGDDGPRAGEALHSLRTEMQRRAWLVIFIGLTYGPAGLYYALLVGLDAFLEERTAAMDEREGAGGPQATSRPEPGTAKDEATGPGPADAEADADGQPRPGPAQTNAADDRRLPALSPDVLVAVTDEYGPAGVLWVLLTAQPPVFLDGEPPGMDAPEGQAAASATSDADIGNPPSPDAAPAVVIDLFFALDPARPSLVPPYPVSPYSRLDWVFVTEEVAVDSAFYSANSSGQVPEPLVPKKWYLAGWHRDGGATIYDSRFSRLVGLLDPSGARYVKWVDQGSLRANDSERIVLEDGSDQ